MAEDIADVLQDIGLTEYQSRAYVAAMQLGTARFSTLSDEADIPQQRIYDVVDDLKKLGLVEVHEGSNGKEAVAVSPEVALGELKEQRIEAVQSDFESAIDDLSKLYSEADTSMGFVTVVNHETSVRRHVSEAIESATWWLFVSLPADWYPAFSEEIRAAIDRGVTVRLLVQGDEWEVVRDASYPDGLQVRYRRSADVVVAADREYAVFRGVAAPSMRRPSLVSKDASMVEMFQRYSEQFWTASQRVQTDHPYPRRYLTPWRVISDHAESLAAGEPLAAYVEGHDTETGRNGSWAGPIVDYEIESGLDADHTVVLPEIAGLVIETDQGRVSVGGWDATLEDVAAHGIEIRR